MYPEYLKLTCKYGCKYRNTHKDTRGVQGKYLQQTILQVRVQVHGLVQVRVQVYFFNCRKSTCTRQMEPPGGRLYPEKLQFKEQTVDELGKANTVLQARMMIIPVGDRRRKEEAGSPEHATGMYLVRQNSKFL